MGIYFLQLLANQFWFLLLSSNNHLLMSTCTIRTETDNLMSYRKNNKMEITKCFQRQNSFFRKNYSLLIASQVIFLKNRLCIKLFHIVALLFNNFYCHFCSIFMIQFQPFRCRLFFSRRIHNKACKKNERRRCIRQLPYHIW